MHANRFNLETALTLIAAYLGLFVGLIDARRVHRGRALIVTDEGRTALADEFDIDWNS